MKEEFKENTRIAVIIQPKLGTKLMSAGDYYVGATASKGTTLPEFLRGMADMLEAEVVCDNHKFNDSYDNEKNTHKCGNASSRNI